MTRRERKTPGHADDQWPLAQQARTIPPCQVFERQVDESRRQADRHHASRCRSPAGSAPNQCEDGRHRQPEHGSVGGIAQPFQQTVGRSLLPARQALEQPSIEFAQGCKGTSHLLIDRPRHAPCWWRPIRTSAASEWSPATPCRLGSAWQRAAEVDKPPPAPEDLSAGSGSRPPGAR